ncbi:MAG TPA: VWA domain-containing protein [Pyrinomonadaceae bacterium]|jgi:Ca-activated chloride channel family protein
MTLRSSIFPRRHFRSPTAHSTLSGLLFVVLCSFAASSSDAQAQAADAQAEEVVRVETNLVAVPLYVTDARGRRVQGLARDDFRLRDAGSTVEISYFAAGTERVALTFLLDASGSTRDTITRQRETALALLQRFGKGSRVSVVRFWEQPETVVAFTVDEEKARQAFLLPLAPNRRTAIFDAALAAVRSYRTLGDDRGERRIVILISDGLDNASTTRAASVVREAQQSGVSIYVVHLPLFMASDGALRPRPTAKGFRDLARDTGGQFFTVGDARASLDPQAQPDLSNVFRAIAEDLQGQYVLGFYATRTATATSNPRPLDVSLTRQSTRKLRIRTLRESYTLSN